MSKTCKYELMPLTYAYDALEPYIDADTMKIHHGKHVQAYTDNLNKALSELPELHSCSLEMILQHLEDVPEALRNVVRNNAGGVYNHNLFFDSMSADQKAAPGGDLAKAIDEAFGSFEEFKTQFKAAALGVFGSGWAWLAFHATEGLKIVKTPNQDTILHTGLQPLLLVDVWEHAYYLKYQNKRADYIDNWFRVINWDRVEERYRECRKNARASAES